MALSGLSERGKALWGYLESMVRAGFSGNQILKMLRDVGLGYRRSDFYNDLRIIKGAVETFNRMQYVPRDKIISDRHYAEAKSPLETNYQTTFKIEGYNTETGERVTRYVTVGHDVLKARGELEDEAMNVLQDTSPNIDIQKIIPYRARKSPVRWF